MKRIRDINTEGMLGSIFTSLVASVLFKAGSMVYDYIQQRKSFEEKLEDAFHRALRRYFHDELQQETVYYREKEKYIERFKQELAGEVDAYESEKYKKLYDYFRREIYRSPYLWVECLFAYVRLGIKIQRQNQQELKALINANSNKLMQKQKETLDVIKQFVDYVSLPSFSIHDKEEKMWMPEHLSRRESIVKPLSGIFENHKILLIHGTKLSGKSTLAKLMAQPYSYTYIDCKEAAAFQSIRFTLLNHNHVDANRELVILDNLAPEYMDGVMRELSQDTSNTKYIITSIERFHNEVLTYNCPDVFQFEIPFLLQEEIEEIIATYHPTDDISEIVSICSKQHPILVQSVCKYLQAKNWEIDLATISAMLKGSPMENLEEFVTETLQREIPDEETRHLLNRILVASFLFTEEEVYKLAQIEPQILQPRQKFNQLKPIWLYQNTDGRYHVTPILKSVFKPDLLENEKKACNQYLGDSIIAKKNISEWNAALAITYYAEAGNYEYAGELYVQIISKYGKQLSEKSILCNMWVGVPLPAEMSLGMRYIIRLTQVMQLENMSNDGKDFVYQDLQRLLDTEGNQLRNASVAYAYMSSICVMRGDVTNALRYRMKSIASGDSIEEGNEQLLAMIGDNYQSGLWVHLSRISNIGEYEQWLQVYDGSALKGRPMSMIDYAGCFLFVGQYLQIHGNGKPISDKIKLLDELLEKAEAYKVDDLIILIVYQKMISYLSVKGYEDVESLYQTYMPRFETNPLAIFVLNDAMGAALSENEKVVDKSISLEYLIEARSVVQQGILPELQLYNLERIAFLQAEKDKPRAVETLQEAVDYANNPDCHIQRQECYFAKGELAQAKWAAGDKDGAVKELSGCIEFALEELQSNSEYAKTYFCKCGSMVYQYYCEVSGEPDDGKHVPPTQGMFKHVAYDAYDEVFEERSVLITVIEMYRLCEALNMLDMMEKWGYKAIEISKRQEKVDIEGCLLENIYPYLLKKGDVQNALYVAKVSNHSMKIAIEKEQNNKGISHWVLVSQVIPLLLLAISKKVIENDNSLYDPIQQLFNDLDDIEHEDALEETKAILSVPVDEMDYQTLKQNRYINIYPVNQIIFILQLLDQQTTTPEAFMLICTLLNRIQAENRLLYKNSLDWIFDDFVQIYWRWRIETRKEDFYDLPKFFERGLAQLGNENVNKAKKYMSLLYYHVRLQMNGNLYDWLME